MKATEANNMKANNDNIEEMSILLYAQIPVFDEKQIGEMKIFLSLQCSVFDLKV